MMQSGKAKYIFTGYFYLDYIIIMIFVLDDLFQIQNTYGTQNRFPLSSLHEREIDF